MLEGVRLPGEDLSWAVASKKECEQSIHGPSVPGTNGPSGALPPGTW
jgi:hypothetical protein